MVLIFSKYFYLACLGSYYTFYLIETFQVSVQNAQLFLFLFLAAVAADAMGLGLICPEANGPEAAWAGEVAVLAPPIAGGMWRR